MSREHAHRGSLTSLRRSSLVSLFESATSKIFPLEPDILDDFEPRRSSPERSLSGSVQEPLMGRGCQSRNERDLKNTRLHQKSR